MTDVTTKPKRRRRVDDDAKMATACAALAEDIKLLASMTYSYGAGYAELVARMDDVIRSMHSVNSNTALGRKESS
jgi:hypothetical protein